VAASACTCAGGADKARAAGLLSRIAGGAFGRLTGGNAPIHVEEFMIFGGSGGNHYRQWGDVAVRCGTMMHLYPAEDNRRLPRDRVRGPLAGRENPVLHIGLPSAQCGAWILT
jgi:hypothetical protein